ncbi:MAG TPA: arylesterase [Tepidisphaeraceae bacterium]|jgi:acyl-CoA thioesterase-1
MNPLKLTIILIAAGCGLACDRSPPETASPPPVTTSRPAASPATAIKLPRVVFLGDSLTAGLGVDPDEAFPMLIAKQLKDAGVAAQVVNAGVSGDTTAGGLRRLDWVLRQAPDVLVVGLGGNDGLRGLSPEASADNLRAIIQRARQSGARVLLLGMMIPPNYGPEYTKAFREIYPKLAAEQNVPLVPFVLEGVGGDPRFNQRDGIHPTAEGHQIIAANVGQYVARLVKP